MDSEIFRSNLANTFRWRRVIVRRRDVPLGVHQNSKGEMSLDVAICYPWIALFRVGWFCWLSVMFPPCLQVSGVKSEFELGFLHDSTGQYCPSSWQNVIHAAGVGWTLCIHWFVQTCPDRLPGRTCPTEVPWRPCHDRSWRRWGPGHLMRSYEWTSHCKICNFRSP